MRIRAFDVLSFFKGMWQRAVYSITLSSMPFKRDAKWAIRDTSCISVVSTLLICAPFLIAKGRRTTNKRVKKRNERLLIASTVLYPVNVALSIPIQVAWTVSYPVRLGLEYKSVRRFNKCLREK